MQDHTKLAVSTGALPESSFVKRMQDIENAIACRAYELFASSGFTDGHDLNDWFTAESELLQPVPLNLSETENELTLKAELPGFTEKEIAVRVEPCWVFIIGQREEKTENKVEGEVVYSERHSSQVFRAIDLPAEVDPDKVEATFDKGTLRIVLAKKGRERKSRLKRRRRDRRQIAATSCNRRLSRWIEHQL
jgi:HSP20 family protein